MSEPVKNHWEQVYQTKAVDSVSWYQAEDKRTLTLFKSLQLPLEASIIDVGSGASILVDQLLEAGYHKLYVLDLSKTALQHTQSRVREKGLDSQQVTWQVGDVCEVKLLSQQFDVWHDRAVFHFMLPEAQQTQYLNNLKRALKSGGYVSMSTFDEHGPTQCSGLPVQRYNITQLQQRLGEDFQLIDSEQHNHVTPWDSEQAFLTSVWQYHGSAN